MLRAFQGIVEQDRVRWIGIAPPVGARIQVVEQELPSVEEQEARLLAIPPEEWQRAFEEFIQFSRDHPAKADISELSDQELAALVHQVREEITAEKNRVADS